MALPYIGGKSDEVLADVNVAAEAADAPKAAIDKAGKEVKEVGKERKRFYIDLAPKRVTLPKLENPKAINIRYPLLPPFAFAHIFWDDKHKELVYFVEEPVLTDTEKEILRIVRLGLNEMINISLVRAKKFHIIMEYLEESVQSILVELGIKISHDTYKKLMYYVYRDSVGLNQIEPIMNDYYIEDIECNGINTPLYLVHRKYENLRTNIIFKTNQVLVDFVEKMAQKSGKYISYAKPLLDAALPDGSRVNATYSTDVTTRGPTFTIRKFTKDPWTPMHLMEQGTANAKVFAYLWLAIEHKFNIMVIGETASGKTTFLNSIISLVPPEARISSIEDTRELNLAHENWLPAVTRAGFGVSETGGKTYGEITIFELLRETFRQTPDYLILGETRGEETYVLFQGMASGHPSFCTFHAGSVETLIRRLETAPINLPPSLVESLDIICVVNHIKSQEKNIRRLREIKEIISVGGKGKVNANTAFQWVPATDKIIEGTESHILSRISNNTGIPMTRIRQELALREKILQTIYNKKIFDYKEFNRLMATYHRDPQAALNELGLKGESIVGKEGKLGAKQAVSAAPTAKAVPKTGTATAAPITPAAPTSAPAATTTPTPTKPAIPKPTLKIKKKVIKPKAIPKIKKSAKPGVKPAVKTARAGKPKPGQKTKIRKS